jgi:hypothetical protein
MSVAGISSSNFFDLTNSALQSKIQKSKQEFQQLGQDLQSRNLSAAKQILRRPPRRISDRHVAS